jgi:transposase
MGKTRTIELTTEQRSALDQGYRKGKRHSFRFRCQMILLKSEKRSSVDIASILGCCEVVINTWLNRYEQEGFDGLQTRAGRARKPKLSLQNPLHLQKVKAEIANHPQSVKTVVANLNQDLDFQMHPDTLKRFFKKMATAFVGSGGASNQGNWQMKVPRKRNYQGNSGNCI